MVEIDIEGIREVHDRFEAIITNLRAQFSKFNDEREKREKIIKREASSLANMDLQLTNYILNFLEWNTNSLLVEEQTIQAYDDYLKGLYKKLRDLKDQREKVVELTEELETKEEDLEMMAVEVRKKNGEVDNLLKERDKLLSILKKVRSANQPKIDVPAVNVDNELEEEESEKDAAFREFVTPQEKPKRQEFNRTCKECGADISTRRTDAKYCVNCYYVNKSKLDKVRKLNKKKVNQKGDAVDDFEDQDDEKEEGKTKEGEELEEEGEYEDVGEVHSGNEEGVNDEE